MSSRTSQRLNPSHYIPAGVARMERSEIRDGNGGGYPDNTISPSALTDPDCAEPVIGRRFAPTRWLHPGYSRYCKVLAAALARMRRYRTHHPHRSCGWLRQAKAAESLIAVPAFYIPARRSYGLQPLTVGGGRIKPFCHSPMCNCTSWMRHLAQARNPYSTSWLWIPGSRGACHRAALCADPLARPGMTE